MPARPRHQRTHIEPRTVPLTPGLAARLHAPGLDPEASLVAAQEPPALPGPPARLRLAELLPGDALAIQWWLLGLTQAEIADWCGVSQPRVAFRIRRGVARLRELG